MRRSRIPRGRLAPLLAVALGLLALAGGPVPGRAQEHPYTLETSATYDVQPSAGRIAVTVDVRFTNTTPDPPGQFSAFDEIELAIHDQATEVAASDAQGDLVVGVAVEDEVNVATVGLREQLRHEQTVELQLRYVLPDGDDPGLRVRPSLVIFPAWSFGTSASVRVTIPADYEVHVDGDPLTEEDGALVSGPIADPTRWLALVIALAQPEYTSFETTVALKGGTADVHVRSFADDEQWGERTLSLVERALPLLEEQIGLPFPGMGELRLIEVAPINATGIGETIGVGGGEILVAFDQPPFTVVHQLGHVWLTEELIAARWIREGMASEAAERVAGAVEVGVPYDPAAEADQRAEAAFPLDAWTADAGAAGEAYGYARSWSVMRELADLVGEDALRAVLRRVAKSIGPYAPGDVGRDGRGEENPSAPVVPLTTRSFLDHLEAVSDTDLDDVFAAQVLTEADAALLPQRAAAREAFSELLAAAGEWGAPEPVAGAMTAWSFEEASSQIRAASAWLAERDELVEDLERAGLAAPDRLRQAYRAHGGGADAQAELNAEREVASAYAATADAVNAERSFVERVGLIGGPDPARQLRLAHGRFAEGDLSGSLDAIAESQQILAAAEPSGIARLASAALVMLVLLVVSVLLFRRRGTYTRPRR